VSSLRPRDDEDVEGADEGGGADPDNEEEGASELRTEGKYSLSFPIAVSTSPARINSLISVTTAVTFSSHPERWRVVYSPLLCPTCFSNDSEVSFP